MGKMGTFRCEELKDFQEKLQQLQDPEEFMEACAKELAARLLRQVIKRTPVGQYPKGSGKTGGTLRRGWTAGKNASAQNYVESLQIQHVGGNYVIEIVNPTKYASYVEYGHRTRNHAGWVPGKFMMTISEQEIQQAAPQILEKKIMNYFKGVF